MLILQIILDRRHLPKLNTSSFMAMELIII